MAGERVHSFVRSEKREKAALFGRWRGLMQVAALACQQGERVGVGWGEVGVGWGGVAAGMK